MKLIGTGMIRFGEIKDGDFAVNKDCFPVFSLSRTTLLYSVCLIFQLLPSSYIYWKGITKQELNVFLVISGQNSTSQITIKNNIALKLL